MFSDEELESLVVIDECTDEELIDFMIEAIQELAVDEEDLIEICEHLRGVEVLTERMDPKVQRRMIKLDFQWCCNEESSREVCWSF